MLTHIYHNAILYSSTLIQITQFQYTKPIHKTKHNYTIKNTHSAAKYILSIN